MLFRVHWFVTNETRLRFCWGKAVPHLWRWELPDAEALISWLLRRGSSDPQPHTLHCLVA